MGSVDPIKSNSAPPCHPSLGSSAPGDIDNDPSFIQLVDANWEAIDQYRKDPSDANVQALMQATNNLNAYLKGHVPTQASDPKAYAIYQALNIAGPHTGSLATICEDYGTANCQATVQYFEAQFKGGNDLFTSLYNGLNAVGSAYKDQGNQTVKTDFDNLRSALDMYNYYMKQSVKDPKILNQLLDDVMADIKKFNDDAKGVVSDGYLTAVLTLINTPVTTTASGQPLAPSLVDLASASPPDYDAIQKALQALGEGSGQGDLTNLLAESENYEYKGN